MKHRIEVLERVLGARSATGLANHPTNYSTHSNNGSKGAEATNQDYGGVVSVSNENSTPSNLGFDQMGDGVEPGGTQWPSTPWLPLQQSSSDLCTDINLIDQSTTNTAIVPSDDSAIRVKLSDFCSFGYLLNPTAETGPTIDVTDDEGTW